MVDVLKVEKLDQLTPFLNDKNIIEIAIRNKNKKFKAFQKIALDQLGQNQEQQKVFKEVINGLNKNNEVNVKNMQMLNNIAKLDNLNLLMNGLNLCATCAGFIIVCKKIDSMGGKINEVLSTIKTTNDLHLNEVFDACVEKHKSMLDCRKRQDYFTLKEMEELVSNEYVTLKTLVNHFISNVVNDKGVLLYSIMTIAAMLSTSLRYYDEMYYFECKDKINGEDIWHISHDEWISVFDKISSGEFVEIVQDYGFLELKLTTSGCDAFYINIIENSLDYKRDISDNQELLTILDDKNIMNSYSNYINDEVEKAIVDEFNQIDIFNDDNVLKEIIDDSLFKVGIMQ